jgi:hypothetical protein
MSSDVRFQITTFDAHSSQFSRAAQQTIRAGLKAEDLPALMDVEPDSVEIRTALAMTVDEGRKYSFKDARGQFCQLETAAR